MNPSGNGRQPTLYLARDPLPPWPVHWLRENLRQLGKREEANAAVSNYGYVPQMAEQTRELAREKLTVPMLAWAGRASCGALKSKNNENSPNRYSSRIHRSPERSPKRKRRSVASAQRKPHREQHHREHGAHLQGREGAWVRGLHLAALFLSYGQRLDVQRTARNRGDQVPPLRPQGSPEPRRPRGVRRDWLERFKPYIEDGKTIVVAPHRVWGPETNDLVLQLRKRKISKVILGGMLANMCVESHLRELLEQGFEVAVAKDATAAPKHPEWGYGYTAALINYAFLAHAVLTTDETVKAIQHGQP